MKRIGKYIGDLVYGANDGIITTFAVVAGVAGAELSSAIVVILGVANLIADGLSMAASNYLARKSEKEYIEHSTGSVSETEENHPLNNAFATFIAFVLAGAIPLVPYILGIETNTFYWAIVATSFALFTVGSLRSLLTRVRWWLAGLEMFMIGAVAAGLAYGIGKWLGNLVQ